jgi:hypothetical protein
VAYPLHEDLERAIERSVDSRPHIDNNECQKIHEELLLIYNCHVVGNIDKQPPFVAALRLLRPVIRGERRLDTWWDLLIRPTIDSCGPRRDSIEEAREFLLRILVFDVEEDSTGELAAMSSKFTRKLLDAYLTRTKIPLGDDVVSPEDEFIAQELEGILVAFGRKKPKVRIRLARDEANRVGTPPRRRRHSGHQGPPAPGTLPPEQLRQTPASASASCARNTSRQAPALMSAHGPVSNRCRPCADHSHHVHSPHHHRHCLRSAHPFPYLF